MTSHRPTLHHLSTLTLPAHVQNDDLAQRFKNEKYVVKMSRSGLSLLIGWLTEGSSGEGTGAGIGFSGETGKRGRSATLGVVNNHLRFDGKYARLSCERLVLFTWTHSYHRKFHRRYTKFMGGVYWTLVLVDSSK